jgi:hypothetical protein
LSNNEKGHSMQNVRTLIAKGPRPRGEISGLRGVRKRGVQCRTPKTPTNNARVTSIGDSLQTKAQILVWWRPLESSWKAVANGEPGIRI